MWPALRQVAEQLLVVRHHDIAHHHKLVALADLLENLQEQIALARAGQPGLAMDNSYR